MKDIKLSNRMKMVVDMVQEDTVADIGCDHAFVSIYLRKIYGAQRVFAMDVRKGPLDIAKQNIAEAGETDNIIVRMSDGLDKLEVGDAQCAVIAGMGGMLVISILEKAKAHLEAGMAFVLQPQSDIPAVRTFLKNAGYTIVKENMLMEEGKYYTAFRAVPENCAEAKDARLHIEEYIENINKKNKLDSDILENILNNYGVWLIKERNNYLKQYLINCAEINDRIYCKLGDDTDSSIQRGQELKQENLIIENALKLFE